MNFTLYIKLNIILYNILYFVIDKKKDLNNNK